MTTVFAKRRGGTSIIIAWPLAPGRGNLRPAVVRIWAAKPAVTGNHLRDALFHGWQTAIVRKCTAAPIRAPPPRSLVGLAGANVEQHGGCYGHYDENELHGSPPARCRAPIGAALALQRRTPARQQIQGSPRFGVTSERR